MSEHGYVPYTHGCRCDVCREAKAAYMRAARARQRRMAELVDPRRYMADIETHGISGYQNYRCRCFTCRAAASQAWNRQQQAKGGTA